jgi:geranylgeranyl diphosphate/geranylgeranyl-bacteriochlorophyllide a reductase
MPITSDERRERFVSLCHDIDVQRLTFEAYMNKKLVKARPLAHIKIGIKNMLHLLGLVSPLSDGWHMTDLIPAWEEAR